MSLTTELSFISWLARRLKQVWHDLRMDEFVTWEGIVATAALIVSLYNLRQVHRAPALARRRELRDQLRVLLERSVDKLEAVRSSIRAGQEIPLGAEVMDLAGQLWNLEKRLQDPSLRVKFLAQQLQVVAGAMTSLVLLRQSHDRFNKLSQSDAVRVAEMGGRPGDLHVHNRDVDDVCKDVMESIGKTIKELNRLESR